MHSLKLSLATIVAGTLLVGCGGVATTEQSATMSASSGNVLNSAAASATYIVGNEAATSTSVVSMGTGSMSASSAAVATASTTTYIPLSRGAVRSPSVPATPDADTITDIRFESTTSMAQTNVPVTFGQIFAPGHLAATASLVGRLDNGVTLPLQLDVKARHPDGSVRHAVVSAVLPSLAAGNVLSMKLNRAAATGNVAGTTSSLLNAGFRTSVNATIGGVSYTASPDELIRQGVDKTWLRGTTANEWHVSAPLKTSAGVAHPHLAARFAVRWYDAIKKARVDVTIENNWAYEAAPQNFKYDAEVLVGGKVAYSKPAMTHYHHARWRKVFWWNGAAPEVNVKHNTNYLIASRALPNYDQSLNIPESVLNALKARWTGSTIEPMGTGLALGAMPSAGGRDDIGMLPQWAAVYLLSMDRRARDVTLGTAELAGSFSSHYRDRNTGQPVSLLDYPYMTLVGLRGDTYNPATKRQEAFPLCATERGCDSPYIYDISHQPAFAYLPYMLTGDHFFLEELQFWSMYNVFNSNPYWREYAKGYLNMEQVRGQAWAMRTLAEAAYITPDDDRLKAHFNTFLDNNLDWYNATYSNNPSANKLGAIVTGYAVGYSNGRGLSPWMDDFFTSAIGHVHELGFSKATSLLKYKVNFPIQRMVGSGMCHIQGAMYSMLVRDSETSPFYTTIGEAWRKSVDADIVGFSNLPCGGTEMAKIQGLQIGEMSGYSGAYAGYPSNMQPALAYAADVGGTDGAKAWSLFMTRTNKPNYALGPQFDILPRAVK